MYDIALMQALQSMKIDRIVLQRAACVNMNLCAGVGTFDGFYKGSYSNKCLIVLHGNLRS